MSISPLSASLVSDLSQHRQNPFQEIKQDFSQLSGALQSGDLTDAQSAYSSIQQLLQSNGGLSNTGTAGGAASNNSNPIQNDFAALGQALQSGDLTQAQSAFSQLQSDVQSAREARGNGITTAPPAQDQYVSSTTNPTPTISPAQQVQQDYAQLASALQSGSLTDAQTAFAALQQALQTQGGTNTSSPASGSSNSTDPILNDFNSLGQALQSGNLSQAQSAFAQLQNDVQSAQQNPTSQALQNAVQGQHHHHGGEADTQTSTTNGENITINIYA
jgi:DNA-binding FadR family transcriptional regulator